MFRDTAGEARYRSLVNYYLKNSHILLLFCDVTRDIESQVEPWRTTFSEYPESTNFLILSKVDLITQVMFEAITSTLKPEWLERNRLQTRYFWVSSKCSANIEHVFQELIPIMRNMREEPPVPEPMLSTYLTKESSHAAEAVSEFFSGISDALSNISFPFSLSASRSCDAVTMNPLYCDSGSSACNPLFDGGGGGGYSSGGSYSYGGGGGGFGSGSSKPVKSSAPTPAPKPYEPPAPKVITASTNKQTNEPQNKKQPSNSSQPSTRGTVDEEVVEEPVYRPKIENPNYLGVPNRIDSEFEIHDVDKAIRPIITKVQDKWTKTSKKSITSKDGQISTLLTDDLVKERNKAFDLLDALSRSGLFHPSYPTATIHFILVSLLHLPLPCPLFSLGHCFSSFHLKFSILFFFVLLFSFVGLIFCFFAVF